MLNQRAPTGRRGISAVLMVAMLVGLGGEGLVFNREAQVQAQSPIQSRTNQGSISALADGDYQQCSQPEPKDRDGAGVCFRFQKVGQRIAGYYGYPHSDRFVCLEGNIQSNRVVGTAHLLSWAGEEWPDIPTTPFQWDEEGYLTLEGGKSQPLGGQGEEAMSLISFERAVLDVASFYQYSRPKMTAPSHLCQKLQAIAAPAQLD